MIEDPEKALLARQESVLRHLSEAVEVTDGDGRIEFVNPAWEAMTGFSSAEAIGRTPRELLRGDTHSPAFWDDIQRTLDAGETWIGRITSRTRSGEELPTDITVQPIIEDGVVVRFVAVRRDVRERLRVERMLRDTALRDPLTGLPNRTLFHDRLEQAVLRAERRSQEDDVAVLFVDLDGYALLVERIGAERAERLIQQVAPRLQAALRPEDTLARLGGDGFTVLLGETTPAHADAVAERLLGRLAQPFGPDQHQLFPSIGVALHEPGLSSEDLVERAVRALDRAKELGRGRVEFFLRPHERHRTARTTAAAALRQALTEGRIHARFEPIVDLISARVVGFETLARWQDAPPGLERPDDFIPLAEETGLLGVLGGVMIKQAGALVAALEEHLDYFPVGVTLNISAGELSGEELVDRIASVLQRHDLDPAHLQLEITEGMAMRDPEAAIRACGQLRRLGVRIALDDFGTGHSSLSYLQRLPVSTVKIDKTFVRFVDSMSGNREIVRAIIALASALGLEVIAEGIERREEHHALLALGCTRGQGYLYARALDHDEALAAALKGAL